MEHLRLILDLDDTLYPERDYALSGFEAVGQHLGSSEFSERCRDLFLSGQRGDIFNQALPDSAPSLIRELVDVYRRHDPCIQLYPDAGRLLTRAAQQSIPLGLITDGPSESQRAKIHALGLLSRFRIVVVTAELGEGCSKPHPAAYQLVERALGPSAHCVYLADNPAKDFLTPNRLGWTSIRIQRPEGLYSRTTPPNPDHAPQHTVSSLDAAWAVLLPTEKPRLSAGPHSQTSR